MFKIGRYDLPLTIILWVRQRTGWRAFLRHGYDVLLTNGKTIHFNEAEKRAYDEALGLHQATVYVYGVAKAHGLRG